MKTFIADARIYVPANILSFHRDLFVWLPSSFQFILMTVNEVLWLCDHDRIAFSRLSEGKYVHVCVDEVSSIDFPRGKKCPILPVPTYMRSLRTSIVLYDLPDSPKPCLTIDTRRVCILGSLLFCYLLIEDLQSSRGDCHVLRVGFSLYYFWTTMERPSNPWKL